jgi:methyl-accepting chemotaxis protein
MRSMQSNNSVSLSKEVGVALKNIHSEVTLISDSTAQIATAVEEQSVVTEQINKNIERINEITILCEESSQEASLLSSGLLDIISDQESLIVQFKS